MTPLIPYVDRLHTVTINGPHYLNPLLHAFGQRGVLVTPHPRRRDRLQAPLLFQRAFSLSRVPRDLQPFSEALGSYAPAICSILTHDPFSGNDSSSGVLLFRDTTAHTLYRFQWTCPSRTIDDEEFSGDGFFELAWTMTAELETGLLDPILNTWLLDLATSLTRPLRQALCPDLLGPLGTALGDALRESVLPSQLPVLHDAFLTAFQQPPEESTV